MEVKTGADSHILFRFIDANKNLLRCYGEIDQDSLKGMSKTQMDNTCVKERAEIIGILESNQMTMTRVVKDRLSVVSAQSHIPMTIKSNEAHLEENVNWAFKK